MVFYWNHIIVLVSWKLLGPFFLLSLEIRLGSIGLVLAGGSFGADMPSYFVGLETIGFFLFFFSSIIKLGTEYSVHYSVLVISIPFSLSFFFLKKFLICVVVRSKSTGQNSRFIRGS
jgi:hypothetical protein